MDGEKKMWGHSLSHVKTDTISVRNSFLVIFVYLNSLGVSCSGDESVKNQTETLCIFAAASLTSVMPKIAESFRKSFPRATLEFNFAASSILAKQIQHGAQVDIFMSANREWVDFLIEQKRLREDSRHEFLSNQLVLIVPKSNSRKISGLHDLLNPHIEGIALADWTHVPAGMYAKRALQKSGIWNEIEAKCIPALDVRAALTYVERGDADCGIVYRSDTFSSSKVFVIENLPAQPSIRYSVALASDSQHALGAAFLSFLDSEEAQQIFQNLGFKRIRNE